MLGLGTKLNLHGASGSAATGGKTFSNAHSVSFNGVDQNARWNDPNGPLTASLSSDADNGTISFWIKLDGVSDTRYIFEKGTATNNYLRVFMSSGNLNVLGYVSGTLSVFDVYTAPLTADTWHMLTLVFSKSTYFSTAVYVDGSAITPSTSFPTSSTAIDPGGRSFVGKSFNTSTYSKIEIDEIAAWTSALSAAEILQLYTYHDLANDSGNYTSSADLIRWWRLENNALEFTGNGSALTLFNSPSFTTDVPFTS